MFVLFRHFTVFPGAIQARRGEGRGFIDTAEGNHYNYRQTRKMKGKGGMDRKKLYLALQSVLLTVLAAVLVCSVIGLYTEGAAIRAEQPLYAIFTRENVSHALRTAMPFFALCAVLTAAGPAMGYAKGGPAYLTKAARRGGGGKAPDRASYAAKPIARAGDVRIALAALAVALIAAGIFNGSALDVFAKAVKICTECIGLG